MSFNLAPCLPPPESFFASSFFSNKISKCPLFVTGNVLDTGDNNSGKRKTPALTEVIPYLRKTWKGWGDEPYRYLGKECFRQRSRRIPDMPERLKESQSSWNRLRTRWRRERRVHRSNDCVELGADEKGQMRKCRALHDLAFTPEWERNPGGSWVQWFHLTSKRITLATVWGRGYVEAKQKQETSQGATVLVQVRGDGGLNQSLHAGYILKIQPKGFADGWETEGVSLLLHSFNHSYIPEAQIESLPCARCYAGFLVTQKWVVLELPWRSSD